MVPERIDLLKIEIEQMSVKYVAIKSSEIKVFVSPDRKSVKQILKPFVVLKTSKNAMKHMILSFKMKGDVISDHFLMLWFQKDSLDTVGFRTFRAFFIYF